MKTRIVEPEILDHLPHTDLAAQRSRLDLQRINFLMGNERWILRTLEHFSDAAASKICEIGAGDGRLVAKIHQRFPQSQVTACDLAPRPAGLNSAIDWCSGDIFLHEPPSGDVLVANLFLHHFEAENLKQIGRLCENFDLLIFNEPNRSCIASFLGMLLHPFVNDVTRHDMQASIRAGFRVGEIAKFLNLDPTRWHIRESLTFFGARRVLVYRELSILPSNEH